MARNKITHDYDDNGNLVVSGSQRQPTLDEAVAYLDRLGWDMPEPGLYLTAVEVDGDITVASGEVKSMTLHHYGEECPVCGHEHDYFSEECPVCHRNWAENSLVEVETPHPKITNFDRWKANITLELLADEVESHHRCDCCPVATDRGFGLECPLEYDGMSCYDAVMTCGQEEAK